MSARRRYFALVARAGKDPIGKPIQTAFPSRAVRQSVHGPFGRVILAGLVFLPIISGCHKPAVVASSPKPRFNIHVEADQPYGEHLGRQHTYDLLVPIPTPSDPPLLVFVHGGGLTAPDKSAYQGLAWRFAESGIGVTLVNYRLGAKAGLPQSAQDVAMCLARLCANKNHPFDSHRIVLMGHSEGAYTIALLAARPKYFAEAGLPPEDWPKGYIGMNGIYDLPKYASKASGYSEHLVGVTFGDSKGWPKESPTLLPLVSKAPWMLIHSTTDDLVGADQSEGFADHLHEQGVMVFFTETTLGLHSDYLLNAMPEPNNPVDESIETFVRETRAAP